MGEEEDERALERDLLNSKLDISLLIRKKEEPGSLLPMSTYVHIYSTRTKLFNDLLSSWTSAGKI